MSGQPIFETRHFTVAHAGEPAIPGYLIVTTRGAEKSLSQFSAEALTDLGQVLARATRLIEKAVEPERVYCARFGEEVEKIHFHLFPRTRRMLEAYRKSAGGPVSAPLIFEWCRKNPDSHATAEEVNRVVEKMKSLA